MLAPCGLVWFGLCCVVVVLEVCLFVSQIDYDDSTERTSSSVFSISNHEFWQRLQHQAAQWHRSVLLLYSFDNLWKNKFVSTLQRWLLKEIEGKIKLCEKDPKEKIFEENCVNVFDNL